MKNMVCTAIISKEDDTYIARDARTNVADEGRTAEEALKNLKAALELYYDGEQVEENPSPIFTSTLEVCV